MRKIFFSLIGSCLLLSGCGSDSSSAGPTSLSALPKATGPVTTSASASLPILASNFTPSRFKDLQLASTGIKFKDWAGLAWGATKSGPMCETGNMIKELLRSAAQPDRILCYMGVMQNAGLFGTVNDVGDLYYEVSGAGEGGALKIKTSVTTENGGIKTFKMYMCEGSTNTEYVSQNFSGSSATVTVVGGRTSRSQTYAQRTTVTGVVNTSTGLWTSKQIVAVGTNSSTSPSYSQSNSMTLTQYADRFDLSGFFSGSYGGGTNQGQMYGIMQGLALTGNLGDFAAGGGTMKGNFNHGSGASGEVIRSWNGDTRAVVVSDSSADYYAAVNAGTLPSIVSVDPSMQSGETWDCTAPSGFTSVSMVGNATVEAGIATCNSTLGFSEEGGGGWVDCGTGSYDNTATR